MYSISVTVAIPNIFGKRDTKLVKLLGEKKILLGPTNHYVV